jgi:uncharacterized cofD-like protein
MSNKRYVVIGGGTGSFTVLSALRPYVNDLTALVSMADDGGSTGVLRDELGVLPPGDIRQCLVALSNAPQTLRDLFNFRFEEGALAGHSFGNLFLSATEKMSENFEQAVHVASDVLRISGRVIPITLDNVRLAAQVGDKIVHGEDMLGSTDLTGSERSKPRIFLEPTAHINPSAARAIAEADVIIIAPGDLYTSLGPLLVVDGVAEALRTTKAKRVYVSNLVVKPHHTKGFTVDDHVEELERFVGAPFIDVVLYNTGKPNPVSLKPYQQEGDMLVRLPQKSHRRFTVVGKNLLSPQVAAIKKGDKLAADRSLIRHDQPALAAAILELSAGQ